MPSGPIAVEFLIKRMVSRVSSTRNGAKDGSSFRFWISLTMTRVSLDEVWTPTHENCLLNALEIEECLVYTLLSLNIMG